MCCCLLRLGFLLLFTGIFVSPRLPAQPCSRTPARQSPSCSCTCGYKVILLQSKMGQETIILPQPFLDGAQGICCCNSGLSCQAKSSGEVSTLAADQPGTAPKKLPHSYHQQNQLPVNYPRYSHVAAAQEGKRRVCPHCWELLGMGGMHKEMSSVIEYTFQSSESASMLSCTQFHVCHASPHTKAPKHHRQ